MRPTDAEPRGIPKRWPEILGPRIKTDYLYRARTPEEVAKKLFAATVYFPSAISSNRVATMLLENGIPKASDLQRRMGTPDGDLYSFRGDLFATQRVLAGALEAARLVRESKPFDYSGITSAYPNPTQKDTFLVRNRHDQVLDEYGFPAVLATGSGDIWKLDSDKPGYSYSKLLTTIKAMGFDSPEQVVDQAIQDMLFWYVYDAIGERRFNKLSGVTLEDIDGMSKQEKRRIIGAVIARLKPKEIESLKTPQTSQLTIDLSRGFFPPGVESGTISANFVSGWEKFVYNTASNRMEMPNLAGMEKVDINVELRPDITDATTHPGLLKLRDLGIKAISNILASAAR